MSVERLDRVTLGLAVALAAVAAVALVAALGATPRAARWAADEEAAHGLAPAPCRHPTLELTLPADAHDCLAGEGVFVYATRWPPAEAHASWAGELGQAGWTRVAAGRPGRVEASEWARGGQRVRISALAGGDQTLVSITRGSADRR